MSDEANKVEEGQEDTSLLDEGKKDESSEEKSVLDSADKPDEGDAADKKDDAESSDADGKADADKDEGAPEEYAEFKLPEGVELDKEQLEAFSPVAKELNLTQEKAQQLVDFYTQALKGQFDKQGEAWKETTDKWVAATKNDKEFGGIDFDKNLGFARKAIDEFGSQELIEALNFSGMGNHPAVVRAFWKIGKAMAEDGFVSGGNKNKPTDPAKILYPDMN